MCILPNPPPIHPIHHPFANGKRTFAILDKNGTVPPDAKTIHSRAGSSSNQMEEYTFIPSVFTHTTYHISEFNPLEKMFSLFLCHRKIVLDEAKRPFKMFNSG